MLQSWIWIPRTIVWKLSQGFYASDLNSFHFLVVVQSLSCVLLFATPWTAVFRAPEDPPLLELSQIHVHWVGESKHLVLYCPFLLLPSILPASGSFPRNHSLHQVAQILELQLQYQSFQWIFRVDFLLDWLVCSPCSPKDSQESSLAPQFESILPLWGTSIFGLAPSADWMRPMDIMEGNQFYSKLLP